MIGGIRSLKDHLARISSHEIEIDINPTPRNMQTAYDLKWINEENGL
jgi:hypothetical protein